MWWHHLTCAWLLSDSSAGSCGGHLCWFFLYHNDHLVSRCCQLYIIPTAGWFLIAFLYPCATFLTIAHWNGTAFQTVRLNATSFSRRRPWFHIHCPVFFSSSPFSILILPILLFLIRCQVCIISGRMWRGMLPLDIDSRWPAISPPLSLLSCRDKKNNFFFYLDLSLKYYFLTCSTNYLCF